MNILQLLLLFLLFFHLCPAQNFQLKSPYKKIGVNIKNGDETSYSITFNGKPIIQESSLGFEFKAEPAMNKEFVVIGQQERTINETWNPVVKSKHAGVVNNCNELQLTLKEKTGLMRQMELSFRAFNDGVAFRSKLFRSAKNGHRQITKELTTFSVPGNPKAWVVEYGKYSSSQESEFFERPLNYVSDKTIAGLPFLMDYGDSCWVAVTEANIDNYPAFYIGTNGKQNVLTTKLVPLPGEDVDGVKARFDDEVYTPWRVVMIVDTPGGFLNVTKEQFKKQKPALVWNTRAAELSKFVIYESPLTVVCDHPDHILKQPGANFLKLVPTTWDDIHFIDGYPGEFVAIAKRTGNEWFVGVMNNSKEKMITIRLDFISEGEHMIDIWADAKDANKEPKNLKISSQKVKPGDQLKIKLADNGGWVARIGGI